MKYITYFSNDDSLKKQFVTSHKENHNNVTEVFDLIDQIYQKGKSDGKTEKENSQVKVLKFIKELIFFRSKSTK